MASYYYASSFSNNASAANRHYGRPVAATYNPYNSNTTLPFMTNLTTVGTSLNTPYIGDEINRSGVGSALQAPFRVRNQVLVVVRREGLACIVAGGECSFDNAFGVALSSSSNATPGQLLQRLILLPNVHALADPNNPPPNPKEVTGPFVLPTPLNLNLAIAPTVGTDSQGTVILDHTALQYSNVGIQDVFAYPFLLQNAWKYDQGASSWYVDTASPIWWASSANNGDSAFHLLSQNIAGISPLLNANQLFGAANITQSYGFEDWPRDIVSPLNNDFNDLVFYMDLLQFPFL